MPTKSVVLHLNSHQPPREVFRARQPHTLNVRPFPEPSAQAGFPVQVKNWTDHCYQDCYLPLMGGSPEKSAYRRFSFNFTPVLLRQLSALHPKFIGMLQEADRLSAIDNHGHGNAIATGFDHTILPLSNLSDRQIQVKWGIEHFKHTFSRDPEGFWAPEAAVNNDTISLLAENGIKFVILRPQQLGAINSSPFSFFEGSPLPEFGKPYRILSSGSNEIYAFFYNPYFASKLSYDPLLESGRGYDLAGEIDCQISFPSAATDTETFGHHKKAGVRTLFDYLDIAPSKEHRTTNFAVLLEETLAGGAPVDTVEIKNPSSWSCNHGVDRWLKSCGCPDNSDNRWRYPFRQALESLAERADTIFAEATDKYINDPEGSKIRYIDVLLGKTGFETFIRQNLLENASMVPREMHCLSVLYDALVPRQGMFVSCAWFFEGMGLETGLSLGAANELIAKLRPFGPEVEADFLEKLHQIMNNDNHWEHKQPPSAEDAYFLSRREQAEASALSE